MTDDELKKLEESAAEHEREFPECPVAAYARSYVERQRAARGGPAQVATAAYRDRYDAIFGKLPVAQA